MRWAGLCSLRAWLETPGLVFRESMVPLVLHCTLLRLLLCWLFICTGTLSHRPGFCCAGSLCALNPYWLQFTAQLPSRAVSACSTPKKWYKRDINFWSICCTPFYLVFSSCKVRVNTDMWNAVGCTGGCQALCKHSTVHMALLFSSGTHDFPCFTLLPRHSWSCDLTNHFNSHGTMSKKWLEHTNALFFLECK